MPAPRTVIIGGGIVGLAVAKELLASAPGTDVTLLEKEPGVGRHQSTHNSGVLHAGLYYKPGSLKARMATEGIRLMTQFCVDHGIAHEVCGKVVVATDDTEVGRLDELFRRGTQNGLTGLRRLGREELREIEPHVAGVAGVFVPEEGIVDYAGVCAAFRAEIENAGGKVLTDSRVTGIHEGKGGGWTIETPSGEHACRQFINCAGLFSDRVAKLAGIPRTVRIVPFRGEYYTLSAQARPLVRNLIYPVPDPTFPFLGVHFTRMIHGGVEAGPNAVLAFAREGYSWRNFSAFDLADALSFPGLWRFMGKHRSMCWEEVVRSLSKRRFCRSLQKLIPEVREEHLEPGGSGVRAQAMHVDGTFIQDFWMVEKPGALHVLNAPSPGATASLAIAREILRRLPAPA